ncbi:MAG TPA: sugar transferase, partial [Anaerolineales bacterium]|nr:sugar transferase [Anaerolineales bacterium]
KRRQNIDAALLNSFGSKTSGLTKRAFDFMASLLSLILLSPIFALIAILIKRDSSGPVFYWGPRIGRNGRVFKMLKFRTMYETPRSYEGPPVTCKEDDRITPFGKWLRDTKLNELPQLWNVLIGDMSMVGPRPEDPYISRTWPTTMARELLSVRPGITSPASVVYRDEESMLHAGDVMRKYLHELSPDKMRLDQLYIRYRSFWLDIDVIFWTALLLIPKIRAYSPPEQFLFVGPITRLIQRYVSWFIWDFLTVLTSIIITGAVVRIFGPLEMGWLKTTEMALEFSALYTCVGIVLKTNRINWPKATFWESGRLWTSWLITTTMTLGIHYYLGFASLRVFGMILAASILSLSGIVFVRYRGRLMGGLFSRFLAFRLKSPTTRERVIIVGSGRTAEHIAWLMDHPTYSGKFQIVGFIDDDLRSQGMTIYGSKVIGRIHDIPKLIQKQDVGLIILADFQAALQKYKDFRDIANFKPAKVFVAPDIFGSLSGLDSTSASNVMAPDLDDFQCQYCLARYAALKNIKAEIPECQKVN